MAEWRGGGRERMAEWRGWRVREDGGVQGCVVMYVPVVCTVT